MKSLFTVSQGVTTEADIYEKGQNEFNKRFMFLPD